MRRLLRFCLRSQGKRRHLNALESGLNLIPISSFSLRIYSSPPLSAGPPQITVIDSDSPEEDADVQSITIPFRSVSSGAFLPMISVDDKWFSEQEFRYFKISFYVSHQLNQLAELL